MTATKFRASLKRLRLPLAELARRLRVNRRTVHRWASGESAVPETVALLLECWVQAEPATRR
jgi:DNA-binding transcriptional regulator YiaG